MITMRPSVRLALRILLVFVAIWGAWEVWYRIELRRYRTTIEPILVEADKPAQSAAHIVLEGDEASRYYSAAAVAAVGEQPSHPTPAYLIGLVQRVRIAAANGATISANDSEMAERALTLSEVSINLANRGATLPFRRFAPGTTFSYRMSGLIGVNSALALHTLNALRAGDAAGAGTTIYSRLRLMRALEEQIFPSTEKARQMSELAADIGMWLGLNPSDAALEQIAEALEEPYQHDELVTVLAKQARFWWGGNGLDGVRTAPLAPVLMHLALPSMRATVAAMDAARRPWPQRIDAVRRLPDDGHQVSYGAQTATINVAIGISSNRASRVAIAAVTARRRGDTAASPLSRGRVSGEGSVDPFTGQPLLFLSRDDGFVVYSVGANGKDDGGHVDLPANGRAPNIPQGADVGVRVRYEGHIGR